MGITWKVQACTSFIVVFYIGVTCTQSSGSGSGTTIEPSMTTIMSIEQTYTPHITTDMSTLFPSDTTMATLLPTDVTTIMPSSIREVMETTPMPTTMHPDQSTTFSATTSSFQTDETTPVSEGSGIDETTIEGSGMTTHSTTDESFNKTNTSSPSTFPQTVAPTTPFTNTFTQTSNTTTFPDTTTLPSTPISPSSPNSTMPPPTTVETTPGFSEFTTGNDTTFVPFTNDYNVTTSDMFEASGMTSFPITTEDFTEGNGMTTQTSTFTTPSTTDIITGTTSDPINSYLVNTKFTLVVYKDATTDEFIANLTNGLNNMYNSVTTTSLRRRRRAAPESFSITVLSSSNDRADNTSVTASYTVNSTQSGLLNASNAVSRIESVNETEYISFLNNSGLNVMSVEIKASPTLTSSSTTTPPTITPYTATSTVLPMNTTISANSTTNNITVTTSALDSNMSSQSSIPVTGFAPTTMTTNYVTVGTVNSTITPVTTPTISDNTTVPTHTLVTTSTVPMTLGDATTSNSSTGSVTTPTGNSSTGSVTTPTGNSSTGSVTTPTGNSSTGSITTPTGNSSTGSITTPTGNSSTGSVTTPTGNSSTGSVTTPTGNSSTGSVTTPTGNSSTGSITTPTGNSSTVSVTTPTGNITTISTDTTITVPATNTTVSTTPTVSTSTITATTVPATNTTVSTTPTVSTSTITATTVPATNTTLSTTSTTTAADTTPIIPSTPPADGIANLVLEITGNVSAQFEQDLADSLVQTYAGIFSTPVTRRRKRSTVTSSQMVESVNYTVVMCNVSDPTLGTVTATFYIIESSAGNSTVPTGASVSGVILDNINTLLATLQANNITSASAVLRAEGRCSMVTQYVGIDIHLLNINHSSATDLIKTSTFMREIEERLKLGIALLEPDRCDTPELRDIGQIHMCSVVLTTSCDVTITFLQDSFTASYSLDPAVGRIVGSDPQFYAAALRSYVKRLPYLFNLTTNSTMETTTLFATAPDTTMSILTTLGATMSTATSLDTTVSTATSTGTTVSTATVPDTTMSSLTTLGATMSTATSLGTTMSTATVPSTTVSTATSTGTTMSTATVPSTTVSTATVPSTTVSTATSTGTTVSTATVPSTTVSTSTSTGTTVSTATVPSTTVSTATSTGTTVSTVTSTGTTVSTATVPSTTVSTATSTGTTVSTVTSTGTAVSISTNATVTGTTMTTICNDTGVALPIIVITLPGWVVPVVIVLGVIAFLGIICLIILIYLCCKHRGKYNTNDVATYLDVAKPEAVRPPTFPMKRDSDYNNKAFVKEEKQQYSERPVQIDVQDAAPPSRPRPRKEISEDSNVTSQDDVYRPKRRPTRQPKAITSDRTDQLFEQVARMSRPQDGGDLGQSRFQTSIHPISLPPIQTPLVSEQLRQNLNNSALTPRIKERADIEHHRNKMRNRRQHSMRNQHPFDPNVDKETAKAYEEAQQSVDEALEPVQPTLFDVQPGHKKFHKRQGKFDVKAPDMRDPDLELLIGDYTRPPGQYSRIRPQNNPPEEEEEDTSSSDDPSPDVTRRKIASLLEDAFSLISPSSQRNVISPSAQHVQPTIPDPDGMIMPQAHGRGSTNPHKRHLVSNRDPQSNGNTLFTRSQPPLVHTSEPGHKPMTFVSPPSASPSGQPAYITPIKKVPNPPGNGGVWTPYRAFDEVSRLRDDLSNPPSASLPNTAPSPSHHRSVTSPVMTSSLLNRDGDVGLPATSLTGVTSQYSDDETTARSGSSAASLVKSIKDELSRLTGQATPVQTLSDESTVQSPR